MANPRKFSEKIALQKQKQAEGTAEFEKIMNEVKATRVVENTLISINDSNCSNAVQQNLNRGNSGSVYVGLGGSSGSNSGASGGGASPDANCRGGGPTNSGSSPTLVYRESRGRSVGVGPMRRPAERKQDRSPYGSGTASGGSLILGGASQTTHTTYLSPPIDSSWRRSNSDSALHQTLNMAEGNYGPSDVMVVGLMNDMNSLHANYAQAHNHQQRSHSPNIGRNFSPQAQKRKSQLMLQNHQQQQQAQQLQQHQLLQIQHQQQAQQQQMQHQLEQQQLVQQQLMSHQQSTSSHYNTKCTNAMGPTNAIFKSLQDQQMNFGNNTGSLPDLTSVHFSSTSGCAGVINNNQTLLTQQHNLHQQQSLTPMVSPHNNGCHPNNREQSSSPYGSSPNSSQQQQQNSSGPTSTANAQTSPHLTFTNLRVQCALNASCQVDVNVSGDSTSGYSILPTLGGTNTTSTSNMTNYRQPLNPPSPGSSPGLLTSTSVTGTELNVSAPPSPIRHLVQIQHTANNSLNGHHHLQKTFGGGATENSSTFNSLNPAFHNHFEQFHLGDSNNQSPQTNYESLEFEDFVDATSQQHQQQSNITFTNKLLDFVGELTAATPPTTMRHNDLCSNSPATSENICHRISNNNNNTTSDNNKNKNNRNCRGSHNLPNHLNNNAVIIAGSNSAMITNLSSSSTPANNNETLTYTNANLRQNALSAASSPISQCMPSASSPLPIPMSSGNSQPNHHQLSLSAQTSPHQSPLHSPHQTSSSLLVSSPILTLGGNNDAGVGLSPIPSPAQNMISSSTFDQDNNQSQTSLQQHTHQKQQQQHQNTTNTNIPQIIFSDYSSSRDIFDHLDLDLGQIDEPGLQMLSDQGSIMIADPSIEDNFRRDLN